MTVRGPNPFALTFAVALGCVLALAHAQASPKGLEQIEHIIIFMQENRPFDHYFGTLKGVRGFNDRTPIMLRSGLDVFHQPHNQSDLSQYWLPFRAEANQTNAMCMPAPDMQYPTDMKMWNKGRFDQWNTARDPGYGMAHFTRDDMTYYYHLYDHYAVGDQYFQSTFTSTTPNRLHLFSGSNGLSVGQQAVLDNTEPVPGYTWPTLGEIFEEKGISWRVYQQLDNFDDNGFAWFKNFQFARPGTPLHDKGMARQPSLMKAFEADIKAGTLPQVSIIIAPTRKSEHATNHPCAGEDFTARLLRILFAHPDTYAKSLFVLNYDEGGQFFDHHWSPTPPLPGNPGYSSVNVEGEVNRDVLTSEPAPIGLGFRVPLLLISPWTRGHIVNSQVFDHTSVIQLLERRFGFECPTLSPWRRMVTGDLTSFFDFARPDYSLPTGLPDTSKYVVVGDQECRLLPDPIIPAQQAMPRQEQGTRQSRALPYEFQVSSAVSVSATASASAPAPAAATFALTVRNSGAAGAAFTLLDLLHLDRADVLPRQYALAAGDSFTDAIAVLEADGRYAFALHGPNGFLREFRGDAQATGTCGALDASLSFDPAGQAVLLTLVNANAATAAALRVTDNAYGLFVWPDAQLVDAQTQRVLAVSTAASGNWYDITVQAADEAGGAACVKRRFMGRMETGADTPSDPAMDAGLPSWLGAPAGPHPPLPAHLRVVKRSEAATTKDARFYPGAGKEDL